MELGDLDLPIFRLNYTVILKFVRVLQGLKKGYASARKYRPSGLKNILERAMPLRISLLLSSKGGQTVFLLSIEAIDSLTSGIRAYARLPENSF